MTDTLVSLDIAGKINEFYQRNMHAVPQAPPSWMVRRTEDDRDSREYPSLQADFGRSFIQHGAISNI